MWRHCTGQTGPCGSTTSWSPLTSSWRSSCASWPAITTTWTSVTLKNCQAGSLAMHKIKIVKLEFTIQFFYHVPLSTDQVMMPVTLAPQSGATSPPWTPRWRCSSAETWTAGSQRGRWQPSRSGSTQTRFTYPALTFVDIYIFIILDSSPHEGLGHRIPKTVGVFMGCQAGQCCHESTMGGDLGQNAARSLGSAHN